MFTIVQVFTSLTSLITNIRVITNIPHLHEHRHSLVLGGVGDRDHKN